MSRKKIVFFIVEGVSERNALAAALEKIFIDQRVVVRIVGGDITSDYKTTPQNVIDKIVDQIKKEMGDFVKPSDFIEVIHLVDLDGVFINENGIVYGDIDSPLYGDDMIECHNVEQIKQRNHKKACVLKRLISLPKVWKTINYSVYFFSCNLDHVLHDERNLPSSLKDDRAFRFALRYKDDTDGFVDFFCNNSFSIQSNYRASWEFIELNNNSLKRYTNFNLLFNEHAKNNNI